MSIALVTLTVTNFPNVPGGIAGAPVNVLHTMSLLALSHPNVDQPPAGYLYVRRGTATLQFNVATPANDPSYPIGIAFAHRSHPATGPVTHGPANFVHPGVPGAPLSPFSALKLSGSSLEITDTVPPPPQGQSPVTKLYKFSVIIQRQRDGAIGIIDPEIENEN